MYDANDDEASDDTTDDDDSWEDVCADDNPDELVIVWFPVMVRYLTVLEVSPATAWTKTSSSPFPTLQRLRC